MTAPKPSLRVHDLTVGYAGGFSLAGLTFSAGPGDVVGLIGPNGAGKSTALKALAGVLRPLSGEMRLGDRPLSPSETRLAFVPQREDVKWDFPATARDVVAMGTYRTRGWFRRIGRKERRSADSALAELGLEGSGGHHISQFSGGQQQRIFLARALVQQPDILLLDEPYTGIDTGNRTVLRRLIAGFRERGVVTLMATHDLDEVRDRCTHVLCLNRRQVAFGPCEEAFTVDNLRATFGGSVAVFAEA
ncbi:MAG: metal ABC transporter ATP-binding protein [Dehalococcoidia bacterium]